MISEAQIQAVAERLRQTAPDATIILFGSHARGEAREGSDLDILVVKPVVDSRHARRLSEVLQRLGMGGGATDIELTKGP